MTSSTRRSTIRNACLGAVVEVATATLVDIADEAMRTAKHSRSGMRFTYCAGLPGPDEAAER